MFRVLTCLTGEHDLRLVVLAGVICFLASLTAINLFRRAQSTRGGARMAWLVTAGTATGCGIWGTHFIAMLAYEPGVTVTYNIGLTVLSLVAAAGVTGLGLGVAVYIPGRWSAPVGGGIVGGGIACMHYLGMWALEVPGRVTWSLDLVAASIGLGMLFGMCAMTVAARRDDIRAMVGAALLLTLAIVSHHFTAMGAVEILPDPTRPFTAYALSTTALAIAVAAAAIAVLGMSLIGAIADGRLGHQKLKLDTALDNMSQGLCMFDAAARLVVCNQRYIEMYGLSPKLVKAGCTLIDILEHRKETGTFAGDTQQYHADLLATIAQGKTASYVVEMDHGRTIFIVSQPMAGGGWVATHEDITERRRIEKQIEHMAHHDALTNLPNRALLRERLEQALASVNRGQQVALLYLDIDNFKGVNDAFGHPTGDELLKAIGKRLCGCLKEIDVVARVGGDEFAIIQAALHQPADAAVLAKRIRETIAMPYQLLGQQTVIDISIGIAVAPTDGRESDQLLKNANMALYGAKTGGRGTYCFFEPEMDARVKARRMMEIDLRNALDAGQFESYYQPIINLETNKISGVEALLRWRHPQRGIILPGEFISIAEEIDLITSIGEWILRKACFDVASWPNDINVAVNLSPVQLRTNNLVQVVINALSASGLPPSRLELEITEAVLIQDTETAMAALHQLRGLGVRIAMDDFGTGYSSLNYLRKFPFDKIKIDRCFISGLSKGEDSFAIVKAVTDLAKNLRMTTTAEGVETEQQLETIRHLGCAEAQGYLFSAPKPAEDIVRLLLGWDERARAAAVAA